MSAATSQSSAAKPQRLPVRGPRPPAIDDGTSLPVDADAPERRRTAHPLSDAVNAILKRLNVVDDAWLRDLSAAWPGLVGPDVARYARPGKLDDGVFYVYVTSSTRLFELRRTHLRVIETRMRAKFGPHRIRQVRLALDPDLSPLSPGSP